MLSSQGGSSQLAAQGKNSFCAFSVGGQDLEIRCPPLLRRLQAAAEDVPGLSAGALQAPPAGLPRAPDRPALAPSGQATVSLQGGGGVAREAPRERAEQKVRGKWSIDLFLTNTY